MYDNPWLREQMTGTPTIRLHPRGAVGVGVTGRVKNQFEVGDSSGLYDPFIRTEVEDELFGVPPHTPARGRPVYGYMAQATGGDARRSEVEEHLGDLYGNVALRLRPERIAHRSTVTYGDSLDYRNPATSYRQAAEGRSPLGFSDSSEYYEDEGDEDLPIEVQVHGGVDLHKDVERADIYHEGGFYSPMYREEMDRAKKLFRQRGVPYAQHSAGEVYTQGTLLPNKLVHVEDEDPGRRWREVQTHANDPDAAMYELYPDRNTVYDTLTSEEWHPGMRNPIRRAPLSTPQFGGTP
jgi:hypothetical protein